MIAYPHSEHHESDYRIDLGYFKASNGKEYQLGVTDIPWNIMNGYACDYTIHGVKETDYTSGRIGILNLFRTDSIHSADNEWKIELYKRALAKDIIKKEDILCQWIDESNCVSPIFLGKAYPTLEKALCIC